MELLKLSHAKIYHIFCKFVLVAINIVDHENILPIGIVRYKVSKVEEIVSFHDSITLILFFFTFSIHYWRNVTLLV